jgi:bla regulator protein blaR1
MINIAWALIHFVWQGAVIAAVVAIVNQIFRRSSANARYLVFVTSLLLMAACPLITFLYLRSTSNIAVTGPFSITVETQPAINIGASYAGVRDSFEQIAPWCVYLWIIGVVLFSLRMLGGWLHANQLKNENTNPLSEIWQQKFAMLLQQIRISRPVRIVESALVQVPMVIGWFRPVILIPTSALAGLSVSQLETIILHELVHVRRYDYLVNLLQSVVEILLFYHPAVWWVSNRIRTERENCCDDCTVEMCGNGILYARALTELEMLRTPQLAMAATNGSLLERIQRIVGKPRASRRSTSWIGGVIALVAILSLAAATRVPQTATPSEKPAQAPTVSASAESNQKAGFIEGLISVGYDSLSVDEIILLKDHGVNAEFIKQIQSAGYSHPDVDDLIRLKDHGVDADSIRKIQSLGYEQVSLSEYIRMKDHGIDAGFVKAVKDAGYLATPTHLIQMRDRGIDAEFIQKAKAKGFANLSINELIRLHDSGVLK